MDTILATFQNYDCITEEMFVTRTQEIIYTNSSSSERMKQCKKFGRGNGVSLVSNVIDWREETNREKSTCIIRRSAGLVSPTAKLESTRAVRENSRPRLMHGNPTKNPAGP